VLADADLQVIRQIGTNSENLIAVYFQFRLDLFELSHLEVTKGAPTPTAKDQNGRLCGDSGI
jgi:hypothetical protein